MSERSGGRERSTQSEASEQVSGVSEQANRRASAPVLKSVFSVDLAHSGEEAWGWENKKDRTVKALLRIWPLSHR